MTCLAAVKAAESKKTKKNLIKSECSIFSLIESWNCLVFRSCLEVVKRRGRTPPEFNFRSLSVFKGHECAILARVITLHGRRRTIIKRMQRAISVIKKLLPAGLLLLAATVANASPSVTIGEVIVTTSFEAPHRGFATTQDNVESFRTQNSELAVIGRELLKPSADSADLNNSKSDETRILPPVPPPYLMALTGFLCVSLVRDRRFWLAPLAVMFWAGQTGFQALPQLALRLSNRNHIEQQFSAELTYPYSSENSSRLRSDIEGTRYIGLLRHLAGIPNTSLIRDSRLLRASSIKHRVSNINKSQPAFVAKQHTSNSLFKCRAYITRQHIRFSPSFIFAQLPRGPPKPA